MAISSHDIVPDSPTNTFAALNPLNNASVLTLGDGNLKVTGTSDAQYRTNSSISISNGKFYVEVLLQTANAYTTFGIGQNNIIDKYPGMDALSYAFTFENATKINNNTQPSYGSALSSGDIFKMFIDLDNYKLFFGKNTTWFDSSDPETGSLPAFSIASGLYSIITRPYNNTAIIYVNFGQDPTFGGNKSPSSTYIDANGIGSFYYPPPTDALALCTANLPSAPDLPIDPAEDDLPEDYFKAVDYIGDGNVSGKTITTNLAADFVWIKNRDATIAHVLFDSVRGVSNVLQSNSTGAAYTDTNTLTNFGSTSFAVGSNDNAVNQSSIKYVAWCWKAGGAPTADNTATSGAMTANSVSVDGTLQSSYTPSGSPTIYPKRMSVNTKAGFSIVKYTGTGSAATVPHGLSFAPEFVIIKGLNNAYDWVVYHDSVSSMNTKRLVLNDSLAASDQSSGPWNSTSPNSNVVSIGTHLNVNESTKDLIMYCWHSVAGYSAFGSYTGNGSTTGDGPFVYTGFKPAWVMWKRTDTTSDWFIMDSSRDLYNPVTHKLEANGSGAEVESATYYSTDYLSNGFKLRVDNAQLNATNGTYIYAAFAEQPFKYANAR